jgi:glycosyltransferase involved in cell wall biosynthesis
MHKSQLQILYLIEEAWPTHRQDLVALFGKYLPRYGVKSDIVTDKPNIESVPWQGGDAQLYLAPQGQLHRLLTKIAQNFRLLLQADAKRYDAIQARDLALSALLGLIIARLKGIKFFYWLSYPQSEGQIDRAKNRGVKAGVRYWIPLLMGNVSKWLLYKIILPNADHVFVQSLQMQKDIAKYGIPLEKMTPVPMGIDSEILGIDTIAAANDPRLNGKRVICYLGIMDRIRRIDILFHMLVIIKQKIPNILLVLVGDTQEIGHLEYLKQEAERLGVSNNILWTGWLPLNQGWGYTRVAELGLSPFPRSYLLDSCSPTKAIEYLALNLAVVVNDNPDQATVVADSQGGLCVTLTAENFAEAVITLLNDDELRLKMGKAGHEYILHNRTYDKLASNLAKKYFQLINND